MMLTHHSTEDLCHVVVQKGTSGFKSVQGRYQIPYLVGGLKLIVIDLEVHVLVKSNSPRVINKCLLS
jgi:hypothetical protein